MDARRTALSALIACRKQGAWADGILKEYIARDKLDRRDAALASRLCYGVLQNRMLLDHYIGLCLTGSLKKLQPIVLDILRLGMYQLLLMDKIPVSAAVNEAVEQTKKYANRAAAGLVNGVLRRAARERDQLPAPVDLSVRYSHPQELVALLRDSIGDERLEALLAANNEAPQTVIQVNTLKTNTDTVAEILQKEGAVLQEHPWMKDAFYLSGVGDIEALSAFTDGYFLVQDPAAKLSVLAAELQSGMDVLDGCAAPGGKSFAAAIAMKNEGHIISCDIHEHKIALLSKGAQRLGASIVEPRLHDGRVNDPSLNGKMDVVLADVPCSGLGVIRKKPDIRYNDVKKMEGLPAIQSAILDNLCRYVKENGVLLYSTCTILRRENEEVVEAFLNAHQDFELEAFPVPEGLCGENNGMLTLLPSVHGTDGFFICKMRRKV